MKRILAVLILGLAFLPVTAAAQKWVEPYVERDGTKVEGHWEGTNEAWEKNFSKPGTVNPYTGQFNTYGSKYYQTTPGAGTSKGTEAIPGSSVPNPYALPGSSSPSPYALPGSSPAMAPKR